MGRKFEPDRESMARILDFAGEYSMFDVIIVTLRKVLNYNAIFVTVFDLSSVKLVQTLRLG